MFRTPSPQSMLKKDVLHTRPSSTPPVILSTNERVPENPTNKHSQGNVLKDRSTCDQLKQLKPELSSKQTVSCKGQLNIFYYKFLMISTILFLKWMIFLLFCQVKCQLFVTVVLPCGTLHKDTDFAINRYTKYIKLNYFKY